MAYGKFDHLRLIDSLRILPPPGPPDESVEEEAAPSIGLEEGGIHAAEQLLMARYLMYTQVYLHPVRRVCDLHLLDFLKEWLEGGVYPTDIDRHLSLTDNEVIAAMRTAAKDENAAGHDAASRLLERKYFREFYRRNPQDLARSLGEPARVVYESAKQVFKEEDLKMDRLRPGGGAPQSFTVLAKDGRLVSSLEMSAILQQIQDPAADYVFITPEKRAEAQLWLEQNYESIFREEGGGELHGG